MSVEEINSKYLTRKKIRDRMLEQAAKIWGYSESEMDDFDPIVNLLIEACAVEIERIDSEVANTKDRMMEKLAELLYPEAITVRPAYGVLQATPSEIISIVQPTAQFVAYHAPSNRKKGENDIMHFFSPVCASHLIKGKILYQVTSRQIAAIENGIHKTELAASTEKDPLRQYSLWLGLKLDQGIKSLENITFFFNWPNDSNADTWYRHLPYTEWRVQNRVLNFEPGIKTDHLVDDNMSMIEAEFDTMKRIEKDVLQIFNRQFVTINDTLTIKSHETNAEKYPAIWEKWYGKKDLEKLEEGIVWIEIKFPTIFSTKVIDSVSCSINTFPVLARKLSRSHQWLQKKLNIFPLKQEGSFLSVREIVGTNGQILKLIPFGNPDDLQFETYTLRYGANRFNERNSYDMLTHLLDRIREESSFFSSLGSETLVQHVQELKPVLSKIDSELETEHNLQSSYPLLAVYSGKEGANITIEFWSCFGKASNEIPMGTTLTSYENNSIKLDHLYLMTTTYGGKDNISGSEKITRYKKSLLTRNRIVTTEDLRAVVMAELRNVKSVDIRKTFRKGTGPTEGFIRHIEIIITPSESDKTDQQQWETELNNLRIVLERQSAGNVPYFIHLNNVPK